MRKRANVKRPAGRTHGPARWGARHRWLAAGLVCASLAALAVFLMLDARIPSAHASPTRYGADPTQTHNAVQAAAWPQQNSIWCGVATVSAIANYQGHAVSQASVASYLNSSASKSEWGTAPHTASVAGPGFVADIAGDFGTDPRSLAAGLSAQAGGAYHERVDLASATDATNHLAADVAQSQQPISVIVDHGFHSVLVAAVFATTNPVTNPSSVTALEVWDPGFGMPGDEIQGAQVAQVPLSTWLSSDVYWGLSYQANYQGSVAQDPDPSVGPYTYNPSQNMNGHLWIGHYVYLRPDRSGDASVGVSPDWAFAQSGALITGQHGEVPAGYTGPTVPIQPPPAPTPTPTPTKTPTHVPTPVPTKAPTAVPTATLVATVAPVSTATEVVLPTATTISLPTSTPVQAPAFPAIGDIPIPVWAALIAAPVVLCLLLVFLVWRRRRRRRRDDLAAGAARRPDGPTTIHLRIPLPGETADSESTPPTEREAILADGAPTSRRATPRSQPGEADQV